MDSILNHNGMLNSGCHLNLATKRYIDGRLHQPTSLTEFQYLRDKLINRLRQLKPGLEYAWILRNEECKGLNLHLLLSDNELKNEVDIMWNELTWGKGVNFDMTPFNQLLNGYSISLMALCFLAPMFESGFTGFTNDRVKTYATSKQ